MTTKDEALKLALEAMTYADACLKKQLTMKYKHEYAQDLLLEAGTAIKDVLAQPEQEPVAWISPKELLVMRGNAYAGAKDWRVNLGLEPEEGDVGLYTTPPQRTWVGLTDEEMQSIAFESADALSAVFVAEAKLKEKNTP